VRVHIRPLAVNVQSNALSPKRQAKASAAESQPSAKWQFCNSFPKI